MGEAKQAVSSLLFACNDPDDLVAALEMRFGRPKYIVDEPAVLHTTPPVQRITFAKMIFFMRSVTNLMSYKIITLLDLGKMNRFYVSNDF